MINLQLSHALEQDAAKTLYDKVQLLPKSREMMKTYADYLEELREQATQKKAAYDSHDAGV
ncbi:hypothetical protein [Desulfovibrio sp. 86]|uniref:Uncharacterized protein n=1 Tax=uncultured Desulfovibrio sp. TaxID=167968 RepID=A0A212L6K3_9BACT|nr:hypothetical protein [Desulfovibrio sp. 86]SCM73204.1 hypothetical protein KL86DES1_21130 [uncultured Desulfovibrio sp.]VZH34028.1 conserved protein of unknown function [Desulfovibrio sp. 86]